MWQEVVRCHEVHIMNSRLFTECRHAIHDLLHGPFPTKAFLGDLIILTEPASQGTAAEKDSPGALIAADGGFFTSVSLDRGDAHVGSFTAEAHLTCGPVYAATARTQLTGPVVREKGFVQGVRERHGERAPLMRVLHWGGLGTLVSL